MRIIKRSDLVVGEIYATITHPACPLTFKERTDRHLLFTAPAEHPYMLNAEGFVHFRLDGNPFIMYPTPAEFMELEARKEEGKRLLNEKRFANMDINAGVGQAELAIGSTESPENYSITAEAAAIIFLYQRDVLPLRFMPMVLAEHHKVYKEDAKGLVEFLQGNHPEVMMEVLKQAIEMMVSDTGKSERDSLKDALKEVLRRKRPDETDG